MIPNAEIEMIPKAHHITALAQPELVNRRMLQFFAPAERDEKRPNEDPAALGILWRSIKKHLGRE